ncbi:MAG: hypothetical protein H0V93_02765 [Euzebyales bacterium]|nr:hypothetical protein [Euzebyales bacterium]
MHPITAYEEARLRHADLLRLRNPHLRQVHRPAGERFGRWLLVRAARMLAREARDQAVEVALCNAGVVAVVRRG